MDTRKKRAMLRAMRALLVGLLLASLAGVPVVSLPSPYGLSQAAADGKVPPGQLTRKSLIGIVNAVASDGSSITIGTPFGNVVVLVTSDTRVDVPPEKDVGIDAVGVGDKVVVKLDRSPLEKVEALPDEDTSSGTEAGLATTTDDGNATTTEGDTTGGGNATTTEGDTTGGGNATTTDTGVATTTDTNVAITTDTGVATTTDTNVATTTDTGVATTTDTNVATTTDTNVATTTDTGVATTTDTNVATTTDTGADAATDTDAPGEGDGASEDDELPPFRTVTAERIIVVAPRPPALIGGRSSRVRPPVASRSWTRTAAPWCSRTTLRRPARRPRAPAPRPPTPATRRPMAAARSARAAGTT